jgi:hypothetical protein
MKSSFTAMMSAFGVALITLCATFLLSSRVPDSFEKPFEVVTILACLVLVAAFSTLRAKLAYLGLHLYAWLMGLGLCFLQSYEIVDFWRFHHDPGFDPDFRHAYGPGFNHSFEPGNNPGFGPGSDSPSFSPAFAHGVMHHLQPVLNVSGLMYPLLISMLLLVLYTPILGFLTGRMSAKAAPEASRRRVKESDQETQGRYYSPNPSAYHEVTYTSEWYEQPSAEYPRHLPPMQQR